MKKRRISERELHTLSLFGGFVGASFGIYFFQHKSAKASFLIKHIVIILGWVAYAIYYFFYLNPLNFLR